MLAKSCSSIGPVPPFRFTHIRPHERLRSCLSFHRGISQPLVIDPLAAKRNRFGILLRSKELLIGHHLLLSPDISVSRSPECKYGRAFSAILLDREKAALAWKGELDQMPETWSWFCSFDRRNLRHRVAAANPKKHSIPKGLNLAPGPR